MRGALFEASGNGAPLGFCFTRVAHSDTSTGHPGAFLAERWVGCCQIVTPSHELGPSVDFRSG